MLVKFVVCAGGDEESSGDECVVDNSDMREALEEDFDSVYLDESAMTTRTRRRLMQTAAGARS